MSGQNRTRTYQLVPVLALCTTCLLAVSDDEAEVALNELTLVQADEVMTLLKLHCGPQSGGLSVRYDGPCGTSGRVTAGQVWGRMSASGHWTIYDDLPEHENRWIMFKIVLNATAENESVLHLLESECYVTDLCVGSGVNIGSVDSFRLQDGRTVDEFFDQLTESSRQWRVSRRSSKAFSSQLDAIEAASE